MHIDIIPNRASTPTILLRESYREGKKVKKRTLANLSSLPMEKVEMIRQVLRGDVMALIPIPTPHPELPPVSVADIYENLAPAHHHHARAVHATMKQLGMEELIGSRQSRERANSMTTARKAGLSSTLAAALRGPLHMDSEFKVR
jgi:hypothetical protein